MNTKQVLAVIKNRIWLIILIPAISAPVAILATGLMPPQYAASATVLLDIRRPTEGSLSGELLPAGLAESYIATQVGVINSQPVAIRAVRILGLAAIDEWQTAYRESGDFLDETGFEDWAGSILRDGVSVQPRKNSRLIDIWVAGPDPSFVAATANAFADAYRETTRDMLSSPASETRSSISNKLNNLRAELEQAQANLSRFQTRTGIFATDERIDIETARLSELSNQILAAESSARFAVSREALLDEAINKGKPIDSLPEILSNATIQSLKKSLAEKESELVKMSDQLGTQHPARKTLTAQVLQLREALEVEIRIVAEGIRNEAVLARSQVASVRQSESEQRGLVQDLRAARDALPPLLQQVSTAGENYNRALEAYGQYDMQISLSQTDVTIFELARAPSTPIGPSKAKNALLALIMGGVLGIVLAFVWELIRPRILSKEDLLNMSPLPYPREIPKART
jgi:uncharacterized protein involved in exopolysaccharide biosynthesis